MKIATCLVVVLCLAGSEGASADPPRYRATDLGSLAELGTFPSAVNEGGVVVGHSIVGAGAPHAGSISHAFLFSDGEMRDLFPDDVAESSAATAVNDAGQVVGYRRWDSMGPANPFLLSPGDPAPVLLDPFDLGNPLLGTGTASGINEPGQVVGEAAGYGHGGAYLLSPPATPALDLTPGLSSPYYSSSASALNDDGWAVGIRRKTTYADTEDGFLYDGVGLVDLDSALNAVRPGASFRPTAINAGRDVVGIAYSMTQPPRAMVYSSDTLTWTDLGTLGGVQSWGYAINTAGDAVGSSTVEADSARHAFLWQGGAMHDLNELVSPALDVLLVEATAINDQGQIAAWGYDPSDPAEGRIVHGFLLTPEDPASAVGGLIDFIEGLGLPHGIENSLTVKLEHALEALEMGDVETACGELGAFVNEVEAQSGKKIQPEDAEDAVAQATQLRELLGCL